MFLKSQVVIRQRLSAKARVQCRISPCETYGGESDTGTGFFFEN